MFELGATCRIYTVSICRLEVQYASPPGLCLVWNKDQLRQAASKLIARIISRISPSKSQSREYINKRRTMQSFLRSPLFASSTPDAPPSITPGNMETSPALAIRQANDAIRRYLLTDCDPLPTLEHAQQQFELALDHSPDQTTCLEALVGLSHTYCYLSDIDAPSCTNYAQSAVDVAERALSLCQGNFQDDLPVHALVHDALGCALRQRYVYLGDSQDCDRAIAAQRTSLEMTTSETPAVTVSVRQNHLANALCMWLRNPEDRSKLSEGLEEAERMAREALESLHNESPLLTSSSGQDGFSLLLYSSILLFCARVQADSVRFGLGAQGLHMHFTGLGQNTMPQAAENSGLPENLLSEFIASTVRMSFQTLSVMQWNAHIRRAAQLGYFGAFLLSVSTRDAASEFNTRGGQMLEVLRGDSYRVDLRDTIILMDVLHILVLACKLKLGLEVPGLINEIGLQLDQILPETHIERPQLHFLLGISSDIDDQELHAAGSQNVNRMSTIEHFKQALRLTPDWHPSQGVYLISLVRTYTRILSRSDGPLQEADREVIGREVAAWSGVLGILFGSFGLGSSIFERMSKLMGSVWNVAETDLNLEDFEDLLRVPFFAAPPSTHKSSLISTAEVYLQFSQLAIAESGYGPLSRKRVDDSVRNWQQLLQRPHDDATRSLIEFGLGSALALQGEHALFQDNNPQEAHRLLSSGISYMEGSIPYGAPTSLTDIGNLATLASAYAIRSAPSSLLQSDDSDLQVSMEMFRHAAAATTSLTLPPRALYDFFNSWVRAALPFEHEAALEAYCGQVDALARLPWVGVDLQARYERLRYVNNALATDAAAYACGRGDVPLAIHLLETGRSVLFAQALPLRNRYTDLRATEPELVSELERVGKVIEERSFQPNQTLLYSSIRRQMNIDEWNRSNHEHRSLGEKWDHLVSRVRKIEGYGDFLQTPPLEKLCRAAVNGPVVLILTSMRHKVCYAIVIKAPAVDAIEMVELSLTPSNAKKLAQQFQVAISEQVRTLRTDSDKEDRGFKKAGHEPPPISVHKILTDLWHMVMKPIVHFVTQNVSKESQTLPHIWMIPTGDLSLLPLHAAGEYGPDGTTVGSECVLDHVVCSYSPSLSALLHKSPIAAESNTTNVFTLGGGDGLFETSREVELVRSICSPRATVNSLPGRATIPRVKDHLRDAHVVHFACHGMQDPDNPLRSRLMFSRDVQIEIEELMREPLPNARLAVLLACETAHGDRRLTDESLHIAGTMLFAGFRGAIGSLWKMADIDGPMICAEFYNALLEGSGSEIPYHKAGQALHRAVCKLKASGVSVLRWATFVHIGQ